MNIVYAITIIVAFMCGFFVAVFCIMKGLNWKMGIEQGKSPTMDNPIKPIVDAIQTKQADKANQYSTEQVNEWLYGVGGK